MASKDIRRIKEVREKDGDWEVWPYPTLEITSLVTGELRTRLIERAGWKDTGQQVTIVETEVSEGYSEFSQENMCEIEVYIGPMRVWGRDYLMSRDRGMAEFIKWAGLDVL